MWCPHRAGVDDDALDGHAGQNREAFRGDPPDRAEVVLFDDFTIGQRRGVPAWLSCHGPKLLTYGTVSGIDPLTATAFLDGLLVGHPLSKAVIYRRRFHDVRDEHRRSRRGHHRHE